MIWIIYSLIVGINLAPMLFMKLDIWHAQGFFSQVCIMLMFSYPFFEKTKYSNKNIPIGFLHIYLGLSTAFFCYIALLTKNYDTKHFFPYFNFLCVLILYNSIVSYLNYMDVRKILKVFKYVYIFTLFISVLQVFNMSQFFALLRPDNRWLNNIVTGFIGQPTHLSGFLAMGLPLFYYDTKTRENVLAMILLFLTLFFTGTTKGDPSITGFIIFFVLLIFSAVQTKKRIAIVGIYLLVGICLYKYIPHQFTADSGRFPMWQYYFGLFKASLPITGNGLGAMNIIYKNTPFSEFRHVHLEALQFLFEIGIIGFVLICNCIYSLYKERLYTREQYICRLIIFGFIISSFFNYPAHLWLPSIYVVIVYSCFHAIKNEVNNGR